LSENASPLRHVVTLVVVAHDGARLIPGLLNAVREQTHPVSRAVGVDTGSQDRSGAVLTELLGGDDPAAVVFAVIYGEDDGDCLTILRRTPPHSDPADAARQLVVACSFRGSVYSRRRAVESLRDAVPAGLVEDVLIDGRSWDLP